MKKKLKLAFLAVISLVGNGCVSQDAMTQAKGKWISVNQMGFIPPNTTLYKKHPPQTPEALSEDNKTDKPKPLDTTASKGGNNGTI